MELNNPILNILDGRKEALKQKVYETPLEKMDNETRLLYENFKWEDFKEIIKNERYFDLTHVEALDIPHKVLIVLGKKDIGKSYQINEVFKLVDQDENAQLIYGRLLEKHVRETGKKWASDPKNPFFTKGLTIYSKNHTMIDPLWRTKKFRGKLKIEPDEGDITPAIKGNLVSMCNLSGEMSSGFFDKMRYIIFDEIISHKDGIVSRHHLRDFTKFCSTVIRNKTNKEFHKIIMFGNNLGHENILLEKYNFFIGDHLKINPARNGIDNMLIINTEGYYEGIDKQGQIDTLFGWDNEDERDALYENQPIEVLEYMIKQEDFIKLKTVFTYVVKVTDPIHKFALGLWTFKVGSCQGVPIMACEFKQFKKGDISFAIDPIVASSYRSIMWIEVDYLLSIWDWIVDHVGKKRMFYKNPSTYSELFNLRDQIKKYQDKTEWFSFFNNKNFFV